MRTEFSSCRNYFQFLFAKGFTLDNKLFAYSQNCLERAGSFLIAPTLGVADLTGQNIRNPLVSTAALIVAIAIVTICFYPVHFINAVGYVCPILLKITPQMAKGVVFALSQTTIVGVCLRALGRMTNRSLCIQWNARKIVPLPIGTSIEKS